MQSANICTTLMQYTGKIIFILAIALPACVLLFFLLKLALYSRRIKMPVDGGSMIGIIGQAKTDIAESGMVMVRGELWHATAHTQIPSGRRVRVIGFKQLALEVEPVENDFKQG
ncbi:MAG: NfeD family protein [Acidobacteriota bacterium]